MSEAHSVSSFVFRVQCSCGFEEIVRDRSGHTTLTARAATVSAFHKSNCEETGQAPPQLLWVNPDGGEVIGRRSLPDYEDYNVEAPSKVTYKQLFSTPP